MELNLNCRVCGSKDLFLYYFQGDNNQYKFYKCKKCALINYDLSGGLDQGKYTISYIDPAIKDLKINIDQVETFNFIKKSVLEKGKLLDIGCGNGRLLLSAKEDAWKVNGIELSEFYASEINSRYSIDVIAANFFEYDNTLGVFDVTVLRHVLEHLPDSVTAMNKINQSLKVGGYGVLEFPNIEGINLKLKRFLIKIGLVKKKYGKNYIPGHCNEFSKKSFKFLLNQTGFKLLKWELYSSTHKYSKVLTLLNISSKARVLIQKIR